MQRILTLLGKPRTIKHQINNRKISWLELFYDLMFAVVISRLTDGLLENLTLTGFVNSAVLFGWFIWGWNETSGYFDNHGNDSIINILIINAEMILTGIGAIFIPEAIKGNFARVSIVLMAIELLLALVWFGLAYFDRLHGPASRVWGGVHLVSLGIVVAGFLLGSRFLFAGIIGGLLLNIFDVMVANPRLAREYERANMKHQLKDSMIERYGLMTMIALGEIIAGLYEPISNQQITGPLISRFIICIILIALVAAIYYQVLGTLQIVLPSSIGTIMTGWLFILTIMFSYYLGVAMQLVNRGRNDRFVDNFAFALSLVLLLAVIRIIVLIGTSTTERKREWVITFLLIIEWAVILLLAFTPATILLIGTAIILLLIILQGRLINSKK